MKHKSDIRFYPYVLLDSGTPGPFNYELADGTKVSFSHLPIYAGKGTGKRSEYHEAMALLCPWIKNHKFNKIRKILRSGSRILVKNSKKLHSEDSAFEYEKMLVAAIGRADLKLGPLTNKTDGGEGASGALKSKKTRRLISNNSKNTWAARSDNEKFAILSQLWNKQQDWWSSLNEDGKEEYSDKVKVGVREYLESISPEERAEFIAERKEHGVAWWAGLSDEKRKIAINNMQKGRKNWIKNRTLEEFEEFSNRCSVGMHKYLDSLTPEEYDYATTSLNRWRATLTPQELAAYRACAAQNPKDFHARLTQDERVEWGNEHSTNIKATLHSRTAEQKVNHVVNSKAAIASIPDTTCPHCGHVGKAQVMGQHHYDKCKSRKTPDYKFLRTSSQLSSNTEPSKSYEFFIYKAKEPFVFEVNGAPGRLTNKNRFGIRKSTKSTKLRLVKVGEENQVFLLPKSQAQNLYYKMQLK